METCYFLLCARRSCAGHRVCKVIGSDNLRPRKLLYSQRVPGDTRNPQPTEF